MTEEKTDITSPGDPTHEATTPPGENAPDPQRTEQAEEQLDQAAGGH